MEALPYMNKHAYYMVLGMDITVEIFDFTPLCD